MSDDSTLRELEVTELRAVYGVAGSAVSADLGLEWIETPGMSLGIAAALPPSAIVLNRGFVANRSDIIADAAERYRAAGVGRFFLHIDGEVEDGVLADAGLAPARAWQLFERETSVPAPERPGDVVIRLAGDAETDRSELARIACDAFDLGEVAQPWIRLLPDVDGYRCYLGEVDGRIAGTGSLFVRGERAMLNFGATAPAFRRRGVQGALLAHRLGEAARLRCRKAHTVTGKAVEGQPQTSYGNIKRAGFTEHSISRNCAPA